MRVQMDPIAVGQRPGAAGDALARRTEHRHAEPFDQFCHPTDMIAVVMGHQDRVQRQTLPFQRV